MRLTEEEVTAIIKAALEEVNDVNRLALTEIFGAPEAHLALARRIERAVVEKWAKEWEMRADIAMTRGFESHATMIRKGVRKMRASLEEKDVAK